MLFIVYVSNRLSLGGGEGRHTFVWFCISCSFSKGRERLIHLSLVLNFLWFVLQKRGNRGGGYLSLILFLLFFNWRNIVCLLHFSPLTKSYNFLNFILSRPWLRDGTCQNYKWAWLKSPFWKMKVFALLLKDALQGSATLCLVRECLDFIMPIDPMTI